MPPGTRQRRNCCSACRSSTSRWHSTSALKIAENAASIKGSVLTEPRHTGRALLARARAQALSSASRPITMLAPPAVSFASSPPVPQPASWIRRGAAEVPNRCASILKLAWVAANHHIRSSSRSSLSYSAGSIPAENEKAATAIPSGVGGDGARVRHRGGHRPLDHALLGGDVAPIENHG